MELYPQINWSEVVIKAFEKKIKNEENHSKKKITEKGAKL